MPINFEKNFQPIVTLDFKEFYLKVQIETQRLFIRSYKEEDFENCLSLYSDEKLTKYFDHQRPRSKQEIEALIQEKGNKYFSNQEPFGLFSVFNKENQDFMGQIDLIPSFECENVVEIGCIFYRKYHNQQFAMEGLDAFLQHYIPYLNKYNFNWNYVPIKKVIATVHPNNYPSKKLIENLGMVFEKYQERFGHPRLWYFYEIC